MGTGSPKLLEANLAGAESGLGVAARVNQRRSVWVKVTKNAENAESAESAMNN